ncbi:MAG: GNAT family N-acetyltransferase [Paracoccus sp. (in: a-proteobacteria)]|nr:GNAT family N-acetyltransferase [Paracoccus sp. (in: a-proteobacteria)]
MELIELTGRLSARDDAEAARIRALLPAHIEATRAEPGCLRFDVEEVGARLWQVDELFTDDDAFAAHQTRAGGSAWGQGTAAAPRDYRRSTVAPEISPEDATCADGIRALHLAAFDSAAEAGLVDDLRRDGDLALSLVARVGGVVLGHIGFSPVSADAPLFALAPVAITPRLQDRGLGSALIRAGLDAIAPAAVVVMGDPTLYRRFGFRAVPGWRSPYAGPFLMALRHDALPRDAQITHAPAFAALGG